ncbi:hypothetical protein [Parasitella parasitica]|uniref:Uncharacterized protein n=1 Tax=Parasitella parasitica TaxID=35722 RepID=A0A0B7MTY8_9FUNG|nr:hypothetical protein [Parasitella parasitica]
MKDKQRSRHEDNANNKLSYLPPSPPSHQKSPQDSHFQSSSAPVGRPPPIMQQPYLLNNNVDNGDDMIDPSDMYVLEEMNAFLLATQEGEPSSLPPSSSNHCFDTMNECPMDFDLCDILGENTGDMDDDLMSFTSDNNDLFPPLPDSNDRTREA